MTMLTKSALAAAILAVMAGAAHAQSVRPAQTGDSRQIQVLPAPQQQVAQAQAATDGAAVEPEQTQPEAQAQEAPQEAPQDTPKAIPQEARPAPKFAPVPPKFVAPKRPAYAEGYGYQSYGYTGYGYPKRHRNHCH